jgi:hypothetical protein
MGHRPPILAPSVLLRQRQLCVSRSVLPTFAEVTYLLLLVDVDFDPSTSFVVAVFNFWSLSSYCTAPSTAMTSSTTTAASAATPSALAGYVHGG